MICTKLFSKCCLFICNHTSLYICINDTTQCGTTT